MCANIKQEGLTNFNQLFINKFNQLFVPVMSQIVVVVLPAFDSNLDSNLMLFLALLSTLQSGYVKKSKQIFTRDDSRSNLKTTQMSEHVHESRANIYKG